MVTLRKQHNLQSVVFCEDRFAKIRVLYAHLTNAHGVRGRPNLNDVDGFRNESSILEFYALKASQICKVLTCFVYVLRVVNAKVKRSVRNPSERPSRVWFNFETSRHVTRLSMYKEPQENQ